jgi:hypothetical protein
MLLMIIVIPEAVVPGSHPSMFADRSHTGVAAAVWDHKRTTTINTASSCQPEAESLGPSARGGLRRQ